LSSKKASLYIILISLFFAAAILGASFLLKGSEDRDTVTYLLIAFWIIPSTYFSSKISTKENCRKKRIFTRP